MGTDTLIKPKLYQGQKLEGLWVVTRKLDGVRALRTENGYVSRNGKPLYNLDKIEGDDIEVFLGSWEKTVSAVRTKSFVDVKQEECYSLYPCDPRLVLGGLRDPSQGIIKVLLQQALDRGDEGLVLRQGGKWYKVKPFETYDVPVTGVIAGKGKHEGKLGAFVTPMGNVGTGLTDVQREELKDYRGTIEVSCMALTPQGKFRHPRFVRIREDK